MIESVHFHLGAMTRASPLLPLLTSGFLIHFSARGEHVQSKEGGTDLKEGGKTLTILCLPVPPLIRLYLSLT